MIDTAQYFVPTNGYVWFSTPGAATPTNLTTPGGSFWLAGTIGNSESDGLPEFGYEGGDTKTNGSWDQKVIRVVQETTVDWVEFAFSQIDEWTLNIYYGSGPGATTGQHKVLGSEINNVYEASMLVVVHDGTKRLGFYAPKVAVTRADSIELDPEEPIMLPVRATLLDYSTTTPRFIWLGSGINPT